MALEMFPKTTKTRRRVVSMRMSEQAIEWLDYLKVQTNAPGRERVLEQLIHDAYIELQARLKTTSGEKERPKRR